MKSEAGALRRKDTNAEESLKIDFINFDSHEIEL